MFEAEATRERVNLVTELDPSLVRLRVESLLLDLGRVNQVLINLVTNAIKFTKHCETRNIIIRMGVSESRPSDTDLHVDYSLGQNARESVFDLPQYGENEIFLWFTVQDSGRGMTQEEKTKVFARFQQASPVTYTTYGGSGLGLYISHSLVGLQGGEIGVATEPGVGSTFSFFVKTAKCASPEPDTVFHIMPPVKAGNGRTSCISVLIVEDNLLNQRVLKKQLSKHYTVHTADNGQEALDFLKTTRHWHDQQYSEISVDVILLDSEMPVMGGLECATAIRKLQKSGHIIEHIPIVSCSANARQEQIDEALNAGMDDAISKPFRVVDLIPKLERLTGLARRDT